ncbi:hypothetical protein EYF80_013607 [Liparis tanakae]|uniref:Uncharacterized protein n=1 Tax=Liparis tanakae TaxID=230148 RepID=A0A4Z2IDP5_9TELE|nr:hypothetical protein EYF80_013607 [Liparis tanakae]
MLRGPVPLHTAPPRAGNPSAPEPGERIQAGLGYLEVGDSVLDQIRQVFSLLGSPFAHSVRLAELVESPGAPDWLRLQPLGSGSRAQLLRVVMLHQRGSVHKVLQECVCVLQPFAELGVGQFLHFAANKVPELLNAVLHRPTQLLLCGPGACRGGARESGSQHVMKIHLMHRSFPAPRGAALLTVSSEFLEAADLLLGSGQLLLQGAQSPCSEGAGFGLTVWYPGGGRHKERA